MDGLDQNWEAGVPSDWEGELGDNDPEELQRFAPFAIQRLQNPKQFGSRQHENASTAPRPLNGQQRDRETEETTDGNDDDQSEGSIGIGEREDENGAIFINSLSYTEFRSLLVEHFDILFRRHRIVWPRSDKNRMVPGVRY